MTLSLGCIADDFTGATDLANNLVRAGMRVVQAIGVPARSVATTEVDAVVVALKSRTVAGATKRSRRRSTPATGCGRRAPSRSISSTAPRSTAPRAATSVPSPRRLLDALAPGSRRRFHDRDACVPRQPAHRVQGISVRGRRAAQRERYAEPSAHADARCEPGARAAGAMPPQGRTHRLPRGRKRRRGHSRAHRGACAGKAWESPSSMPFPTTICCGWDRRCKDMPLVTAGSGVAIGLPANFGIAPSERREHVAACGGVRRPSCRAAARRPRTGRCACSELPDVLRSRSTRCRSRPVPTLPRRRSHGRPRCWPPGRC